MIIRHREVGGPHILYSSEVNMRNVGLKDEDGEQVEGGLRLLDGNDAIGVNARIVGFIDQLFPQAPAAQTPNFVGTVCVRSTDGRVAAMALEQDAPNNKLTTLPVSLIQ